MSDSELLKKIGEGLPQPWTVHFHASSKKIYYKNAETGEMQWNDPSESSGLVSEKATEESNINTKSPHTKSALRNDKDLLELSEIELASLCVEILTGFVVGAMVGVKPVKSFVADVMGTWALKSPPFHNFAHATDTLTTMTRLLHPNYCDAQRFLYPPEAWALGLAPRPRSSTLWTRQRPPGPRRFRVSDALQRRQAPRGELFSDNAQARQEARPVRSVRRGRRAALPHDGDQHDHVLGVGEPY
jgi:hypothetical protein